MKWVGNLQALTALLADGLRLDTPRVDTVVPVIRSGDQMIFRIPGRQFLSTEQRRRLKPRLDPGLIADDDDDDEDEANMPHPRQRVLLGDIVVEFGFDAADEADLQDFCAYFEDYILEMQVSGIRYRGTYAVYSSSEKTAGKYRTIWSFRGKKAVDRMTEETENTDSGLGVSNLGAVVRRLRALADTRPGSGRSQNWYQPAWGFRS